MAILRVNVVLPERSNTFFNAMADLLPKQIFNVDPEFMIPRLEKVEINGTAVPFATVNVFINGINQSPVPDIVADANGAWSGFFMLTPGQNTVQVQFFPPVVSGDIENAYSPTLFIKNVLVYPTLFSRFPMQNTLQMLLLDGSYLYLGSGVISLGHLKTLGRFNILTGASIILDELATTPTSGLVHFMAIDSSWLYVSQTMSDASIKVSRYAKDLSARLDNTGFASVPNALYSDGTSLFAVRSPGDIRLAKLNPTTMALVGSEISIKNGALFEFAIGHNAMGDDGTNLMIPTSRLIAGDTIGDAILAGSPDLGGNFIFNNLLFHRKVLKSTLTPGADSTTLYTGTNSPDEAFVGKNSMVRFGGFWYSLVLSNPGKVVKMQEVTLFGLPGLEAIEVTPLPFSAADSENDLPTRMKLGPDSRLYVVGNAGMARFTPGSTSIQWMARGAQSLDVTGTDVAVVDDTLLTRAIDAAPTIFTDRAQTFTVVAPTAAPTNVRCHFNQTRTSIGVGWAPMADGNGVIIEQDINGGGYVEVGREYFGSGHVVDSTHFSGFISGDVLSYRTRSFNLVGSSVPSASAFFNVPFLTPNLGGAFNLVATSVVGSTVNLQWEDHEIVVGGPVNATTNRSHHLYIYRSTDNLNFTHVGTKSLVVTTTQPDGSPVGGAFYFNPLTRSDTLVQFTDTNGGAYPYYYKVRQVQGTGPSLTFSGLVYGPGAYSNTITTDAPPAVPTGLAANISWEGVVLTWNPGVGGGIVTNYAIERSTNNGVGFSPLVTVGNVTTYTDATASAQPQVMYRVYAIGPGGNSTTSSNSNNISPVFDDAHINNIDSTNGPLLIDGTYAYAISRDSTGVPVVITRIALANSGLRMQNLSVYTPVGTFANPSSAIYFGGFIYILIKDTGELNCRILKVDPATLTVSASLALTTGNTSPTSSKMLVTDGTDCWAISGLSGAYKVTHFDPVTMTTILTGPSLGANITVATATAFGGSIYVGYRDILAPTSSAARISTSTLTIVETVASNADFTNYAVNDGTSVYIKGRNAGSGLVRVEKFTVGPLAFSAQTADLGPNGFGNMVYDSGSNALYMQQDDISNTFGFQKISTAPAFVSFIADTHFGSGTYDGARTDGTNIYISNGNGYVAKKLISAF